MEPGHHSTVILNLGHDTVLLSARHMVLESAGYIVESTSSIARALKSLSEGDFDLVVVCHSLTDVERAYLTDSIRETGSTIPVINVDAADRPTAHPFGNPRSGSSPGELLHKVEAVLYQRISKGAE